MPGRFPRLVAIVTLVSSFGGCGSIGMTATEARSLGVFYSALTLPGTHDISDEINMQVSAVGGEAVVDLAVSVSGGCDALNAFPFLNMLPIWPGCVPVKVTGTIVRREEPLYP